MDKKISVVVCAKNEERIVGKCLRSLKKQAVVPEIIVVDAHSKDKTVSIAKKYADKILYDNGKGISDARNIGWRAASADIVAYCDCDSRPTKDWTKKILKNMRNRVAVSGPIFSYDGSDSMKKKFFVWAGLFPLFVKKLGINCIWGANMAFRKNILRKYRFRTKFLEDFDMSRQLAKISGVEFIEELRLPVSSRRFNKGFHRTCAKYYVIGGLKILLGNKKFSGYF